MNGLVTQVLPLVLMFAVFYFLLIRPQQKRQKSVAQMQSSLQKGDHIITIGGLHGIVDSVSDTTLVLVGSDGSRLTFDRSAVREVKKQQA